MIFVDDENQEQVIDSVPDTANDIFNFLPLGQYVDKTFISSMRDAKHPQAISDPNKSTHSPTSTVLAAEQMAGGQGFLSPDVYRYGTVAIPGLTSKPEAIYRQGLNQIINEAERESKAIPATTLANQQNALSHEDLIRKYGHYTEVTDRQGNVRKVYGHPTDPSSFYKDVASIKMFGVPYTEEEKRKMEFDKLLNTTIIPRNQIPQVMQYLMQNMDRDEARAINKELKEEQNFVNMSKVISRQSEIVAKEMKSLVDTSHIDREFSQEYKRIADDFTNIKDRPKKIKDIESRHRKAVEEYRKKVAPRVMELEKRYMDLKKTEEAILRRHQDMLERKSGIKTR